jgi:hypothetical protein
MPWRALVSSGEITCPAGEIGAAPEQGIDHMVLKCQYNQTASPAKKSDPPMIF